MLAIDEILLAVGTSIRTKVRAEISLLGGLCRVRCEGLELRLLFKKLPRWDAALVSIHRRAAQRDENEPAIVNHLRDVCRCEVYRLSQPVDLMVRLPRTGTIVLLEVKAEKGGRITDNQQYFFESWAGSPIAIVRTPSEAHAVVRALDEALPEGLEDCYQEALTAVEK